jgi:hypothetical protein
LLLHPLLPKWSDSFDFGMSTDLHIISVSGDCKFFKIKELWPDSKVDLQSVRKDEADAKVLGAQIQSQYE